MLSIYKYKLFWQLNPQIAGNAWCTQHCVYCDKSCTYYEHIPKDIVTATWMFTDMEIFLTNFMNTTEDASFFSVNNPHNAHGLHKLMQR